MNSRCTYPSVFLALFAAVFCPSAAAALRKLTSPLFPSPTLIISTLAYATASIVLATQVSHHDASPVLHVLRVMADGEFFNKWEYVEIVWKQVLFFVGIINILAIARTVLIQSIEVVANLQLGYKMRLLKIRSEIAVL